MGSLWCSANLNTRRPLIGSVRENHHLDLPLLRRVEREQLLGERKGHARGGGAVQALQLQLLVARRVFLVEGRVLLLRP